MDGLLKLKSIELLKKKEDKVRTTKQWPTKGFTYNDYHDLPSKDGY
jgi:hypothetical protein